jgi:hypothetical protein
MQWTLLLLATISVLSSRDTLQAQEKLERPAVGTIQAFPEPDPQSDHVAINEHKKVLRAGVAISPNTILRFSPSGVKLHTLPLTDYGKVVVFASNPDQVEVWSADQDEDVGSPVADRPYVTRICRWQAQDFLCGPPKRKPGVFTPGGISDPGIEIR